MKSSRRRYPCRLRVNLRLIHEIVIDPHYENKHAGSINDGLILELVSRLAEIESHEPIQTRSGFSYFVNELDLNGRMYRLVWMLETQERYLGVINAFRRF